MITPWSASAVRREWRYRWLTSDGQPLGSLTEWRFPIGDPITDLEQLIVTVRTDAGEALELLTKPVLFGRRRRRRVAVRALRRLLNEADLIRRTGPVAP